MTPKPCILIAGPTAGGKSALAVAVAKAVGGVVINADSMQVYHPLQILTARPTSTDEAGVAHRLYGVVSGEARFSVGRWLARATAEIDAARGQGLVPVLVGGTGLYFKALLGGLAEIPDIPGDIRAHWADVSQAGGPAQLARELARLDPAMAARLEPGDRQRMVRALEVMSATGRSLADWQNDTAPPALATAQTVRIVLSPARADIHARIARRVDAMLQGGAIDEVKALLGLGLAPDLPVMKAIGVAEIGRLIDGQADIETTARDMATATRRYAKRQATWARKYMADWHWVEAGGEPLVNEIAVQAATIVA